VGTRPYAELLAYYKSATALLFPSVLESFGLPLIEAAAFGTPVFAADLPYAHEVLDGYGNVSFADPGVPEQWADLLRRAADCKPAAPLRPNSGNSWKAVFGIIDRALDRSHVARAPIA